MGKMDGLFFSPVDHSYFLGGERLVSVTQVLEGVGLVDFSKINHDILRRAADFGTSVHLACQLDDLGDLDEETLDPNLKGYLEAWRSFRGDTKFDAIEQPLCHRGYGFAGTPDRITYQGKPTIVDLKTGTIVYPVTGIQLSGYAILADIPMARRLAVQLKPDGKFSVVEYNDRKDREIFLAALAVTKWKEKYV